MEILFHCMPHSTHRRQIFYSILIKGYNTCCFLVSRLWSEKVQDMVSRSFLMTSFQLESLSPCIPEWKESLCPFTVDWWSLKILTRIWHAYCWVSYKLFLIKGGGVALLRCSIHKYLYPVWIRKQDFNGYLLSEKKISKIGIAKKGKKNKSEGTRV